jgi:hypothetical protein
MPQPNDLSRSLVALDQDSTIIAVVEMSQSSWLVAGMEWFAERRSAAQAAQYEAVLAGYKVTVQDLPVPAR